MRLAVAVVVLTACRSTTSGTAVGPRSEEAPGNAVHFSRPPVVDGSRRACLEPPHVPKGDALADGTPVTHSDDRRAWEIVLEGEREMTGAQVSAELEELRLQPGLGFVSNGLHCGDRQCLSLAGNLCELGVDDAFATLRAGVAAVPAFAGARLRLSVRLEGNLGPRCAADDPACLPIPYGSETRYDAARPRSGDAFPSHSAGACAHDGDCMVLGCGNHCVTWEYGGAHEAATCEGYSFQRPVFCGCVERECEWFTQP